MLAEENAGGPLRRGEKIVEKSVKVGRGKKRNRIFGKNIYGGNVPSRKNAGQPLCGGRSCREIVEPSGGGGPFEFAPTDEKWLGASHGEIEASKDHTARS